MVFFPKNKLKDDMVIIIIIIINNVHDVVFKLVFWGKYLSTSKGGGAPVISPQQLPRS